ncbi:MAG: TylF/MycF family methyltransferase [Planctomycetota bacterium]
MQRDTLPLAREPAAISTDAYLDLVKRALTGSLGDGAECRNFKPRGKARRAILRRLLPPQVLLLERVDSALTEDGRYWPAFAQTMLGRKRLDNVQHCVETALAENVPGDFIETGVWRGGACILMRAILKARGETSRRVWVADSFQGLPKPDASKYAADEGDRHHTWADLAISLASVQRNFERYGLLDDQVRFLKGWFKDTLPTAPIERLAVARLDGDMYESTMDGLVNLYPKLSPRGFLIVDDYGAIPACKQAVHDYREKHGVREELVTIDWTGVYWRKA